MTSAFISYSHTDRPVADFLAAHLHNRGVEKVFIDYQELRAGDFVSQLGSQIVENDYFLVVITPRSVASKWVRAEIGWAFAKKDNSFIIPIWLEPASLTDVFVLSRLERVDFTRWYDDRNMEAAVNRLAKLMHLPSEPINNEPVPEPMLSEAPELEQEDNENALADDIPPPSFARGDITSMFQSALAAQDSDPERALYLYRQVMEIDPSFMRGQIVGFVARQEEKTKPARLAILIDRMESAKKQGNWTELRELAITATEIDPANSYAQDQIDIASKNAECEPMYEQARIMSDNANVQAMKVLMYDIQETCPDHGDPEGLLIDEPISRNLLGFLRERQSLVGHLGPIEHVAFSNCARYLATASRDQTIATWSLSNGKMIKSLNNVTDTTRAVKFSLDNKYLAALLADSSIVFWHVNGWRFSESFKCESQLTDFLFTGSGKQVVASAVDGAVYITNVPEFQSRKQVQLVDFRIKCLEMSGDGLLYTGLDRHGNIIRAWTYPGLESKHIGAFEQDNGYETVRDLLVSDDGKRLVVLKNFAVEVRKMPQGRVSWAISRTGRAPAFKDMSVSPFDPSLLILVGDNDDRTRLTFVDVDAGKEVACLQAHDETVNCVAISDDGRFIATGSDDCTVKIWQL